MQFTHRKTALRRSILVEKHLSWYSMTNLLAVIKEFIVEFPTQNLKPHPNNWRLHPEVQKDLLSGLLDPFEKSMRSLPTSLRSWVGIVVIDRYRRPEMVAILAMGWAGLHQNPNLCPRCTALDYHCTGFCTAFIERGCFSSVFLAVFRVLAGLMV